MKNLQDLTRLFHELPEDAQRFFQEEHLSPEALEHAERLKHRADLVESGTQQKSYKYYEEQLSNRFNGLKITYNQCVAYLKIVVGVK